MAKRPEESDGRVVPQGGRKPVPTVAVARGGKATTASEEEDPLRLRFETAENPQGAGISDGGPSRPSEVSGAEVEAYKQIRTTRDDGIQSSSRHSPTVDARQLRAAMPVIDLGD